jgi:hypothetical protein
MFDVPGMHVPAVAVDDPDRLVHTVESACIKNTASTGCWALLTWFE